MTKNQIEFGGSDTAALLYIQQKGYASYSSMVNVRDKKTPSPFIETPAYRFGKELHSRFLEHKKIITLTPDEEQLLKNMVNALCDDPIVMNLMQKAKCEVEFDTKLDGLRVYGRIDILTFAIGDLKTTRLSNIVTFANEMDFLQAALYLRVTKKKDFYYVGTSKVPPYKPMVFNVNQYPERMIIANKQLDFLIDYIKFRINK